MTRLDAVKLLEPAGPGGQAALESQASRGRLAHFKWFTELQDRRRGLGRHEKKLRADLSSGSLGTTGHRQQNPRGSTVDNLLADKIDQVLVSSATHEQSLVIRTSSTPQAVLG